MVSLHVVDQLDCCEDYRKEDDYAVEKDCVEEGEANKEEREENDGDEEVEDGEPLVVDHLAAPQLCAEERPAKEWEDEEEGDSKGIYQRVHQSYLQGITAVSSIRTQGSKDPKQSCSRFFRVCF